VSPKTEIDPKFWETVCKIVRRETADLVASGRVSVEEKLPGPDANAVVNGPLTGAWAGIEIQPSAEGASALYLDLYGEVVALGPGVNGAILEVFSGSEPDFEGQLTLLIRSVKEGRYAEHVTRGDEYAYTVEMRFGGLPEGRDWSEYRSIPEPEHPIREGENTYAAW
jgi:hypothetical protein